MKVFATYSEDRVICEMDGRQVITEDSRWYHARLTEFEEKILDPLHISEYGGEGTVLILRGTAAERRLLGRFSGHQVRVIKHTVSSSGLPVVKVTGPIRICKKDKS
ncbi:hypothetical protein PIB30_027497 [Stylosanthes scabra]|uniref:Uncharacterized protein n=1 Tax=Stylosanthes scabra TaxID=79078 RepID=A0ABU6RAX7_9FABA|nr:hypothetical protein [Stylosanthes scabra]